MSIEDDPPRAALPVLGALALDRMGIAELEAYIVGLQGEIARAEAEVVRKTKVRDAADSVFRR